MKSIRGPCGHSGGGVIIWCNFLDINDGFLIHFQGIAESFLDSKIVVIYYL